MRNQSGYIYSLIFYLTASFGVSLTIKASIGVSAVNSTIVAISEISSFKVGTIMILVNAVFLIGYIILTRFKYLSKYFLQALFFLLFGSLVNLYLYKILIYIDTSYYLVRILLLVSGVLIGGSSIGIIIHFNLITFPIESFCMELEHLTNRSFAFYRYGLDILLALLSIYISLMFQLPLFLREGTIISILLLTASMNFSKSKMENNHNEV